jgi:hypothetical protein
MTAMTRRPQWTPEQARDWYGRQPWPAGCNYIPSNAVNQLEMWWAETFDEAVNDRELGWAAGLGFNTMRVYLHDIPWSQDRDAFLGRIDRFLTIASRHGIRPMFVLFDGVWDPHPTPGPQPPPIPRVHNSRWVQSPGAEILDDPARHDELRPYVAGVIGHFRDDPRVLAWDLFNEPDNPNPPYRDRELPDKAEKALMLLRKAYAWAREAGPTQPITSGLWRPHWVTTGALSEMDRLQLTESDVISFHAYVGRSIVEARLAELEAYGRPVFLTEYLARPYGNTFETILPLLKERKVAAYSWGLVSGKTQTIYPWDSWTTRPDREPDPWFHDILRPDGTPYDPAETDLIRRLTS